MSENNNIVEGWLRSLNMVQYTQSFIDNGYDDLEVCKQIGELDLDAIGINKKEHREKLYRAVRVLREEGGTAVYFTLEETIGATPQLGYYDDSVLNELGAPPDPPDLLDGQPIRLDAYDIGKNALLTYPKVQLKHILKNKLKEDEVDLAGPPYTTQEYGLCRSSLTALAVKYAEELKTHFEDVLDRLEDLWRFARELDSYTLPVNHSPMHGIYGSSVVYGFSARNVPPPLPSIPPPSTSHAERCTDLQCHLQSGHRHDNYVHQNYVAVDGDPKDGEKKKTSTLSRFLRNIGIRRSGKKHSYKQHSGDLKIKRTDPFSVAGDPNAFDITMSDEERIALMVMVKEGKISTETALEVVRRFEDERLRDSNGSLVESDGKENMGNHGSNNMSKKKKNPSLKPIKSQSAVYSDSGPRCHICQHIIVPEDYEDHQLVQNPNGNSDDPVYVCCRHKRVHSVGHIEYPHNVHSPLFTRAMSCSPSRNPNAQLSTFGGVDSTCQSPSQNRLYSPILAHTTKFMQPSLPQGMEAIKERLSGKTRDFMHKTTSRTSLLSSESDHSMECAQHGQLKPEVLTTRNDESNYCSNSTVSMSSENSPAIGRKKELEAKNKSQQCHRSASYSTGDDCISSENDEHDNAHLLGGLNRDHRNKLGGRLREMRFELKKKVLKNKEERHHHPLPVSNCSAYNNRPPLLRTTSQGGYIPPAPAPNTQMPLYGCFQPSGGEQAVYTGPFLGKARVVKSFAPCEEERDFLQIEKGDIIHIINMAQSGVWRGALKGLVGNFHFCNVEVIVDDAPVNQRKDKQSRRRNPKKSKPKSVEELMQRIGLEHLTSLLLLNGYDQLEILSEMDEDDLNILNISDPEQRAKLLTAAELLLDFDSTDTSDSHVKSDHSGATSDTPCSLSPAPVIISNNATAARSNNDSRDSGCYASSEQLPKSLTPHNKSPLSAQQQFSAGKSLKGSHCKTCNSCGKPKAETEESMDTDKSDREYTEEDKEVSAITNHCPDEPNKPQNPVTRSSSSCAKSTAYGYTQCRICKHNSSRASGGMAHNVSEGVYPRIMGQSAYGQQGQGIYGKHKKPKPVPPPRTSSAQDSKIYADRKAAGIQVDYQSRVLSPSQCNYYYHAHPVLTNSHSFGGQSSNPKSPPPTYKSGYTKDGRKSVEPIYAASQKTLKNVSRSLIPLVTTKLGAEKIDFSLEPYSNAKGECDIPPLLVQRYAEELRQDIISVALVLEQVRIIQLQSLDRLCVPNERLAESCSEACDLKIASMREFFISIGLPMYTEDVIAGGVTTIEQLLKTSESQFNLMTGADSRHLKRLMHAIEWVRGKLSSPTRATKNKPIINIIDKV